MASSLTSVDALKSSVRTRWEILDWDKIYPWWRRPAKVRLLLYADSSVHFNGGSFLGLQYVMSLLQSRAYYYVDFDIATAHRDGTDPSATISGAKKLTDLDIINKYDEIWFFGLNSTPNLTPAEVTVLDQFMAAPKSGGVLVTGDHADLGKGIAGQIKRAGQMRLYPAPPAASPGWNTTLVEGPDANATYDFDEQSDDTPQRIRYRRYSLSSPLILQRRYRPHPVLCGPDGPIDVLPDHQHEGEAIAPAVAAGDPNWPTKAGHQEKPEVIAWGRIKDPSATKHGQEIGVISAYNGHNVDVGRIVADSTWHHWFDINITGVAPSPSAYAGFDATANGQAALKKIDTYFLNCAVWLAPPDRQSAMRNAAWWHILWTDRIVELPLDLPIWIWGEQAIDALGRRASRCSVTQWVFDFPIFKEKIPRWEWPQLIDKFRLIDLPLERFVAGGILRELARSLGAQSGTQSFPTKAPEDAILEKAMTMGVESGLSSLASQVEAETRMASELVKGRLRVQRSRAKEDVATT
jgi:hypothetical protein